MSDEEFERYSARLDRRPAVVIGSDDPAQDTVTHHPHAEPAVLDMVEVWGHGSFPASDPPANW